MSVLSDELSNDPLAIGYSGMSDQAAANSLNAKTRPTTGDVQELREYLFLEKNRSNTTGDTIPTFIIGRLKQASETAAGGTPYGTVVITLKQKHACTAFLEYISAASGDLQVDFDNDSRFNEVLEELKDAGVISNADKNAIKAISSNSISRAHELGIKKVLSGDVALARA